MSGQRHKPYKCPACQKPFAQISQLTHHTQSHPTCSMCGLITISQDHLDAHIIKVHGANQNGIQTPDLCDAETVQSGDENVSDFLPAENVDKEINDNFSKFKNTFQPLSGCAMTSDTSKVTTVMDVVPDRHSNSDLDQSWAVVHEPSSPFKIKLKRVSLAASPKIASSLFNDTEKPNVPAHTSTMMLNDGYKVAQDGNIFTTLLKRPRGRPKGSLNKKPRNSLTSLENNVTEQAVTCEVGNMVTNVQNLQYSTGNAETFLSEGGETPVKRPRGRPKGSKSKRSLTDEQLDVLRKQIYGTNTLPSVQPVSEYHEQDSVCAESKNNEQCASILNHVLEPYDPQTCDNNEIDSVSTNMTISKPLHNTQQTSWNSRSPVKDVFAFEDEESHVVINRTANQRIKAETPKERIKRKYVRKCKNQEAEHKENTSMTKPPVLLCFDKNNESVKLDEISVDSLEQHTQMNSIDDQKVKSLETVKKHETSSMTKPYKKRPFKTEIIEQEPFAMVSTSAIDHQIDLDNGTPESLWNDLEQMNVKPLDAPSNMIESSETSSHISELNRSHPSFPNGHIAHPPYMPQRQLENEQQMHGSHCVSGHYKNVNTSYDIYSQQAQHCSSEIKSQELQSQLTHYHYSDTTPLQPHQTHHYNNDMMSHGIQSQQAYRPTHTVHSKIPLMQNDHNSDTSSLEPYTAGNDLNQYMHPDMPSSLSHGTALHGFYSLQESLDVHSAMHGGISSKLKPLSSFPKEYHDGSFAQQQHMLVQNGMPLIQPQPPQSTYLPNIPSMPYSPQQSTLLHDGILSHQHYENVPTNNVKYTNGTPQVNQQSEVETHDCISMASQREKLVCNNDIYPAQEVDTHMSLHNDTLLNSHQSNEYNSSYLHSQSVEQHGERLVTSHTEQPPSFSKDPENSDATTYSPQTLFHKSAVPLSNDRYFTRDTSDESHELISPPEQQEAHMMPSTHYISNAMKSISAHDNHSEPKKEISPETQRLLKLRPRKPPLSDHAKNSEHFLKDYPADMINGVSVDQGFIGHHVDDFPTTHAQFDQSPYSLRDPGSWKSTCHSDKSADESCAQTQRALDFTHDTSPPITCIQDNQSLNDVHLANISKIVDNVKPCNIDKQDLLPKDHNCHYPRNGENPHSTSNSLNAHCSTPLEESDSIPSPVLNVNTNTDVPSKNLSIEFDDDDDEEGNGEDFNITISGLLNKISGDETSPIDKNTMSFPFQHGLALSSQLSPSLVPSHAKASEYSEISDVKRSSSLESRVDSDVSSQEGNVLTKPSGGYLSEFMKFIETDTHTENEELQQIDDSSRSNGATLLDHTSNSPLDSAKVGEVWTRNFEQEADITWNIEHLRYMRNKTCQLVTTLFPVLHIDGDFRWESNDVETLLDDIINIAMTDKSSEQSSPEANVSKSKTLTVELCKTPQTCLNILLRKVTRFVRTVLPDVDIPTDVSLCSVNALINSVISENIAST